jgi:hypothetical protein
VITGKIDIKSKIHLNFRSPQESRGWINKFAEIDEKWQREEKIRNKKSEPIKKHDHNPMKDMGLLQDGRAIGSVGNIVREKIGIGALQNKEEILDVTQFRMNMSMKFHQNIEDRVKGNVEVARWFICQTPGHAAKDCKYGLT